MIVSLVAALDEGRTIGLAGDLPWSLPDDQKYFRRVTRGHCLVMGRKTFDSIGSPLPGRTNILLTRNLADRPEGTVLAVNLDAAIAEAESRGETELFVAGGAAVYREALPRADRMYLTRVHAHLEGDTFFPEWDPADWKLMREEHHDVDERHAHPFTIEEYERARPR